MEHAVKDFVIEGVLESCTKITHESKKATHLKIRDAQGLTDAILHMKIPKKEIPLIIGMKVHYSTQKDDYRTGLIKAMYHDTLFIKDGPLTGKQYAGSLLVHNEG